MGVHSIHESTVSPVTPASSQAVAYRARSFSDSLRQIYLNLNILTNSNSDVLIFGNIVIIQKCHCHYVLELYGIGLLTNQIDPTPGSPFTTFQQGYVIASIIECGKDTRFHPTPYWACDYLSMLIHVSKWEPWGCCIIVYLSVIYHELKSHENSSEHNLFCCYTCVNFAVWDTYRNPIIVSMPPCTCTQLCSIMYKYYNI